MNLGCLLLGQPDFLERAHSQTMGNSTLVSQLTRTGQPQLCRGNISRACGRWLAAPRRTWGGSGEPMECWCTWFGARSGASPRLSSPTLCPARRQVRLSMQVVVHRLSGCAAGRSWRSTWLRLADGFVDLHDRRPTCSNVGGP